MPRLTNDQTRPPLPHSTQSPVAKNFNIDGIEDHGDIPDIPMQISIPARSQPRGMNAAPDIPCFFVELDFPTAKLDLDKVQKVCRLCL
jgi:hypothetical protein